MWKVAWHCALMFVVIWLTRIGHICFQHLAKGKWFKYTYWFKPFVFTFCNMRMVFQRTKVLPCASMLQWLHIDKWRAKNTIALEDVLYICSTSPKLYLFMYPLLHVAWAVIGLQNVQIKEKFDKTACAVHSDCDITESNMSTGAISHLVEKQLQILYKYSRLNITVIR